ncbi:MAG: transcription antitermination factor NusB [Ornithinimicrobium sp.]
MADRPARSLTRPADRTRTVDAPRYTAYLTMQAVADGAYANLDLPARLRAARLGGRDAAFATELCFGTIRMQGLYDQIITVAADREISTIDRPTLDVMRLGAHQILAMRIPDHAAVNAGVAMARHVVSRGAGGFVNAVLRRITERSRDAWVDLVRDQAGDPLAAAAAEHSHPVWVARALRAALLSHQTSTPEEGLTDLTSCMRANNVPGPLTLAARGDLVADAEFTSIGLLPSPVAPTAWTLPSGDPGDLGIIRSGRSAVQDAGSQLVVGALLNAAVSDDCGRWLDLCAGPGGKAGLMAATALDRSAHLVANDISEHRGRLVAQTLRGPIAAGADVEVRVGDGREVAVAEPEHYDRVLVDAPCTGLGALRRRPEVRWRRTPSDLVDLGPIQRELLSAAVLATRPGGVIVYATCSPHIAETTLVVDDVCAANQRVVVEDVRSLIVRRDGSPHANVGGGPMAQLWPQVHGTDAMFIALLRRL